MPRPRFKRKRRSKPPAPGGPAPPHWTPATASTASTPTLQIGARQKPAPWTGAQARGGAAQSQLLGMQRTSGNAATASTVVATYVTQLGEAPVPPEATEIDEAESSEEPQVDGAVVYSVGSVDSGDGEEEDEAESSEEPQVDGAVVYSVGSVDSDDGEEEGAEDAVEDVVEDLEPPPAPPPPGWMPKVLKRLAGRLEVASYHQGEEKGRTSGGPVDDFVSALMTTLPRDMRSFQRQGKLPGPPELPDLATLTDDQIRSDRTLLAQGLKRMWGWTDDEVERHLLKGEPKAGGGMKVKYLATAAERAPHAVELGPTLRWAVSQEPFDTGRMVSKFSGPGYAIFVMDRAGNVYAGQHKVGLFHHSSFMGGRKVTCAGELKVTNGQLQYITSKSGHYAPTPAEMQECLDELHRNDVPLDGVPCRVWLNHSANRVFDAAEFRIRGVHAMVIK